MDGRPVTELLAIAGDGVDREAGPVAAEFLVVDVEVLLAVDGESDHGQAILGGREGAVHLVRRHGGGDEDRAIHPQRFGHVARDDQMPEVDRVEGAAEDSCARH